MNSISPARSRRSSLSNSNELQATVSDGDGSLPASMILSEGGVLREPIATCRYPITEEDWCVVAPSCLSHDDRGKTIGLDQRPGHRQIETIRFNQVPISFETARKMAETLRSPHCTLSTLHLVGCLDDPGATAIVLEALKGNTSVRTLDLSRCVFDPHAHACLSELLEVNRSLSELKLSNVDLGAGSCGALGKGLSKNTTLVALDLSLNRLQGIDALVAGLEENTCLKRLILKSNQLNERDGQSLGALLAKGGCLESLDVSLNLIGTHGAHAILEALGSNGSLRNLDLSFTDIDKVTQGMLDGLGLNTTLCDLQLKQNDMFGSRVGDFFAALENNKIRLGIPGDLVEGRQVADLLEALSRNSGVTALDFASTVYCQTGSFHTELASRIDSNYTLTHLKFAMGDEPVGDERRAIHRVLERNRGILPGIGGVFEGFATRSDPALPPEIGLKILSHVSDDNDGRKALHDVRLAVSADASAAAPNQASGPAPSAGGVTSTMAGEPSGVS